jgi:hypothetical protein
MSDPEREDHCDKTGPQLGNKPSGIAAWLIRQAQQFEDQHAPQHLTIGLREAAGEIKHLRALLTPKPLDENAPKDRMLIGLERPPYEDKTYYSMVQWREDTQQWMMEAGVDWSVSPGRRVWAYCGVSHYLDPLELPGLPYWEGKDEEDEEDDLA